jgi:hypothetical protein
MRVVKERHKVWPRPTEFFRELHQQQRMSRWLEVSLSLASKAMACLVFGLLAECVDCWVSHNPASRPFKTHESHNLHLHALPSSSPHTEVNCQAGSESTKTCLGELHLVCVCWQSGLRDQVQMQWIMEIPQLPPSKGGELLARWGPYAFR